MRMQVAKTMSIFTELEKLELGNIVSRQEAGKKTITFFEKHSSDYIAEHRTDQAVNLNKVKITMNEYVKSISAEEKSNRVSTPKRQSKSRHESQL